MDREPDISGVYFADSFGSMDPVACQIFEWLGSGYSGQIGFHGHDNKGLALANSLALVGKGISLIDSTICGMGRGAGNTKTEFLLGELESLMPDSKIQSEWVEHLSASEGFQQLVEKYRWGASLPYYKAANHGIHPSYVQALVESDNFSMSEIITALDELDRVLGNHLLTGITLTLHLAIYSRAMAFCLKSWDSNYPVKSESYFWVGMRCPIWIMSILTLTILSLR